MDMGEGVLEVVHHGEADELGVHGLQCGHAPGAAPTLTSWRPMERQQGRMAMAEDGWLEAADLPNRDTGCQPFNDEISDLEPLGDIFSFIISQYLQLLCKDTRRGF